MTHTQLPLPSVYTASRRTRTRTRTRWGAPTTCRIYADVRLRLPMTHRNGRYAGVYVPTLAEAIVWANNNGTYTGAELKGIAVGNGCSGHETGVRNTCFEYPPLSLSFSLSLPITIFLPFYLCVVLCCVVCNHYDSLLTMTHTMTSYFTTQYKVCGGQRDKYDTEYLLGTAFVSSQLKTKIRAKCDFDGAVSIVCEGQYLFFFWFY